MKRIGFIVGLFAVGFALAGCGGKDEAAAPAQEIAAPLGQSEERPYEPPSQPSERPYIVPDSTPKATPRAVAETPKATPPPRRVTPTPAPELPSAPAQVPRRLFPHALYSTGKRPQIPTVADVNGDLIPDVLTPNEKSNDFSLLLGRGDGSFAEEIRLAPSLEEPSAVAVRDFTGDGNPDLMLFGKDSTVLLPGLGGGAFGEPRPVAGVGFNAFGVADLDGNGTLDLLGAPLGGKLLVLLGDGEGTFAETGSIQASGFIRAMAIADFNLDGHPDFVTANMTDDDLSIGLGKGDGSFAPVTRIRLAQNSPTGVAVADFNGDGLVDIVTGNGSGQDHTLLFGNGDGTFRNETRRSPSSQVGFVTAGDFNGDGNADFAFGPSTTFIYGKGNGDFEDPVRASIARTQAGFVIQDLNGDRFSDLVLSFDLGDGVIVVMGEADGTFGLRDEVLLPRDKGSAAAAHLALGDMNGDGATDAVVTSTIYDQGSRTMDTLAVLLGDGEGNFTSTESHEIPLAGELILADLNRDQRLDVIVYEDDREGIAVFMGRGDGSIAPARGIVDPSEFKPLGSTGIDPRHMGTLGVGDVTGDGIPDLMRGIDFISPEPTIYQGRGDGSFSAWSPGGTSGGNNPRADPRVFYRSMIVTSGASLADLDGDGNLDFIMNMNVVWGDGNGGVHYVPRGALSAPDIFQVPQGRGTGYGVQDRAIADLNGDGLLDVIMAADLSGSSGRVLVFMNAGNRVFRPGVSYRAGTDTVSLAIGDANGDGALDLFAVSVNSQDFAVLLGNGDGTFRPRERYALFRAPRIVEVGDVNGDGLADVLAIDSHRASRLLLHLQQRPGPDDPPSPPTLATGEALIAEASQEWEAEDFAASVEKATEALYIFRQIVGDDDPRTDQVRAMIGKARKMMD